MRDAIQELLDQLQEEPEPAPPLLTEEAKKKLRLQWEEFDHEEMRAWSLLGSQIFGHEVL